MTTRQACAGKSTHATEMTKKTRNPMDDMQNMITKMGWQRMRVTIHDIDHVELPGEPAMADENRKSVVKSFSTTKNNDDLLTAELDDLGIGLSDFLHELFKEHFGDEWEERNPKGDEMRIQRIREARAKKTRKNP